MTKIMKSLGKTASLISLIGNLAFSGCNVYHNYKTINLNEIPTVNLNNKRIAYHSIRHSLTPEGAIQFVRTPEAAAGYTYFLFLRHDDKEDSAQSFEANHNDRVGNCVDYAAAVAALLSDNGYPPLMLVLDSKKDNESHSLFFYKTEKGVGAVDRSGAYGIYKNIDDLIKDYNTENNQDYEFSAVIDLDRTYPDKRWMFGDKPISVYK